MLIPFVVGLMFVPMSGFNIAAAILFGVALATDWLDGHLARRWNQTSAFGAFLDPVADKLIVCAVLVILVYRDPHYYVALPAAVTVGRELTVSALREWMAELGERGVVATANYIARRYGVKRAMPGSHARRLCPQLIFVKPDPTRYREMSKRVLALLSEVTDVIEPASIDEFYFNIILFLDMSY